MSEFILVVPPDYVELENATDFVVSNGEEGIRRNILYEEWSVLENLLQAFIPNGFTLTDIKLIDLPDAEERIRLWYKIDLVA
jgi:hypothetical protein